jgi:alpha-1,6-mannosyltransferase
LKRDAVLLACLGGLLEISILAVYCFTGLNRTSNLLEPFFAIPFAFYLAIVVWITHSKSTDFRASTVIIIGVAVVLYLTFLFQTPSLSGDIYRYIWDGKLLSNGISPYEYPPYASQLAYLRDANWQLVENKNIISPYPPFLEFLNALTYIISPTVVAFKATTILGGLGIIVVLPFFLKKINFDPRLTILFAWNPLFVLEFGSSGHDDTVALFLVLLSMYFLVKNQRIPAAGMMALGVVSKLFPLLIVPIFLKRWGARATSVFAVVVAGFYVPFLLLGGNVLNPISVYLFTSTPVFNGGVFSLLQNLFSASGAAVTLSRVVEYSVFGAVLIWMLGMILKKPHQDIQLMRYAGILITVYIAFSSTIQPWYVSWVFVPFLVVMPTWSWVVFSGTVFLTYYTFTQQPISPGYWAEIPWVKFVEFAQLYGMMAYEIVTRRYFVLRKIVKDA